MYLKTYETLYLKECLLEAYYIIWTTEGNQIHIFTDPTECQVYTQF